jgi:bacillolysin
MRNFLLALVSLVFILTSAVSADNGDDGFRGPNNLRNSQDVSMYRENERGIPEFVRGNLLPDKAGSGNEFQTTITFFEQNKGAFKMAAPAQELQLRRMDVDRLGMKHVRIDQYHNGVRVIGGEYIAHYTADGRLQAVNGNYEPYIELETNPLYTAENAQEIAYNDLATFFGVAQPQAAELVIFPWQGEHYLAWRLFLLSDSPPGRWEYLVDARTGDIIFNANRIMEENDIGTGTNVMGQARNHIDTDWTGTTYQMKDYTRQLNNNPHGHDGEMPDGNYIQTNIALSTLPGTIATDADNIWGTTSTQAPAVDGHVYTAAVYDWLLHTIGRNGYNDNGASMLTIVNYSGDGDNNAYWDGSRIVVWSWSSGWRSLAACPDVIAHEWGHAVTEYTSNLVYQLEPGALNEAYSDIQGAAFEWAHDTLDVPDWDMGENGRESGVPFRSMEDPHLYSDPDYYGTSDPYWVDVVGCTPSWLNDYCGVHTNSGVGNKWFYLLSDGGTHHEVTVTGISVEHAMEIAYRANAFYWTSTTDYHNGALGTIWAAMDLDPTGAWANQVSKAWNAVGVSTPGPSLIFSYPNGIPETCLPGETTTFEVDVNGMLGGEPVSGSGQLHYSIDGGSYVTVDMNEIWTNKYMATLPAAECESSFEFYVSANETSTGMYTDPDPANPHTAIVATGVVVAVEDNFESDLGWTVSGNATDGQWDRGVPVGGGDRGDPPGDFDGSGSCYLTDNVDGNTDVDGGTTTLTSPTFDLSGGDAKIHYARWFSNNMGSAPYTDTMKIYISNNNGSNWTLIENVGPSGPEAEGGWYENSFWASEFVTPTNQMRMRFDASDLGDGSVVEAAIDDFWVKAYECYDSALAIMTDSLPDWTVDMAYYQELHSIGGSGTKTWTDKNGDLVGTGLALSTDGIVSGTPLSAGPISFTAVVEDEAAGTDEKAFSFTINPAPVITTSSLPDWTAGLEYTQQLQSTGGTAPTGWMDKNSDLSGTGLTLSLSGLLSGTPSGAASVNFIARITDAAGATDEQSLAFEINPAVEITTLSTPDWTVGMPYSHQFNVTGGTGTITWLDMFLDLEGSGLTFSPDGLLSGTPNVAGPISFTARAVDQVDASDVQEYNFTINPMVEITTTSLPDWTIDVAYSQQLAASGGTSPKVWMDKNGDLDGTGLTMDFSGLISGTPGNAGTIDFVAGITDAAGAVDEQAYSFEINPVVTITTENLPTAKLDSAYSFQIESGGGTGAHDWSDLNNDLDGTGFALSSEGMLSGTPLATGEISFTAHAEDQVGSFDENLFMLEVVEDYICGDANADIDVNISDAVYIINYIFTGGNPPDPFDAGNVNCDGEVNVSDAVWIVNFIFVPGSPAPCECTKNVFAK